MCSYGRNIVRARPSARSKKPYPSKWRVILEKADDGRPAQEIAKEVGCSQGAVLYWRSERVRIAAWEGKKKAGEGERRCTRCGLAGEEQNPIGQSGLCLWCRLEIRGVSLLRWYASGAAEEYLRRQRNGYGK